MGGWKRPSNKADWGSPGKAGDGCLPGKKKQAQGRQQQIYQSEGQRRATLVTVIEGVGECKKARPGVQTRKDFIWGAGGCHHRVFQHEQMDQSTFTCCYVCI
jgi:hypothetical protein